MRVTIPDTIEPVIGWKGLAVDLNTMELRSIYGFYDYLWPHRKEHTAMCKRDHEHEGGMPGIDCSCGFYIARSWPIAMGYTFAGGALVEVAGWGKVIEHRVGWRTRYAYPKRIILLNAFNDQDGFDFAASGDIVYRPAGDFFTQEIVDVLSEKYGVPVTIENYSDYPSCTSPRVPALLAARLFLSVFAAIWSVSGIITGDQVLTVLSWVCIALLAIAWCIPLQRKAPHEKKEKKR